MNMNMIFNGLWNISIQFAGIVLVILAVRKIFDICHVPKKFAYFLWIIPLVRLLWPLNIEGRISLWPEKITTVQSQLVHEAVNHYEKIEDTKNTLNSKNIVSGSSSRIGGKEQNSDLTQIPEKKKEASGEKSEQEKFSAKDLEIQTSSGIDTNKMNESSVEIMIGRSLLAVWLLGFFILLLRNFLSYFQLKKQVKISIPVEEGVYKADHIYTAFVLGFFKPAVYLPHYISEEQYRYVLTHENVHIQRKDYLFKLIASLVRYFYWWNPFVWIAYYFMEKDMEMSCDEAVIKVLGEEEKGAYAKALLELTTAGCNSINMSLCFAESTPKNRIKNIMKYKKPLFLVALAGVVVLCVLFIGLLTTPKTEIKAEDTSGKNMADAPDEFFGEYIEENLYSWNEQPAVWKFGEDGILKVTQGGSYNITDDETGNKILYTYNLGWGADIKRDENASGKYEIIWQNQRDDSGPKKVSFRHLDGTDGFGDILDGKFLEENNFKGSYRCTEGDVDMVWQFFSTGTYLVTTKTPYTMNPDGKIVLKKRLAFEMGGEDWNILFNYDKDDCRLAIQRAGEETDWDHPYIPIENLLREGTYHYMGTDGKTRQNFYLRLSGNSTEGSYNYYCGKGAGFRPDYEKTEDYSFYSKNSRHGEGTYTIKNGVLILTSDDGGTRYFKINGTKLLFMEKYQGKKSANSEIPFIFENGAVFEYTTNEMYEFSEREWKKLLFKANNTVYCGSSETTLVGEPEALEGTIRSSVEEGTVPEFNGESNFGGIGDTYTYPGRDDQIGVLMGDGEYHVFYKLD